MTDRNYRNVFLEIGKTQEEINKRVEDTFNEIFYGKDKFFSYTGDGTMAYLEDTGNNDTRTEGISYGMMMCVQLDKKKEFDCLWNWAKTNMFMTEGENAGYFAWSVATDGSKNADGPAPDGEEFFAMALFFASHRWGDGSGIYEYSKEARELLHTCIHMEDKGFGHNMWNRENHLIKFVPGLEFTDPSYHLPHFYELFALWANEEDRDFWKEAAASSRRYLQKACNKDTGLSAEYSEYDGSPYLKLDINGRHDWYYSDAYRTIANIALDYEWFSKDTEFGKWSVDIANKLQCFFGETVAGDDRGIYELDGRRIEGEALHPVAITATNAQASLAADGKYAYQFVEDFWNCPLRTGERRYYDNCLYMFAMLALSGMYRIY